MAEHTGGLLTKEKFNLRPKEEIQMCLKSGFITAISYSYSQKKQTLAKLSAKRKVRQHGGIWILRKR